MSSTPPVRKALKAQPKNTVRRSKAERDALEKAENERKRIRAEAAAAEAAADAFTRRAEYGLASGSRGGRGADRGGRAGRGGRGGFMGSRIVTRAPLPQSSQSGPMPSSGRAGFRNDVLRGRPSVKTESGIKKDPDGDIAMLGIKQDPENYGYISSDEDESGMGPRVNVDEINLASEDEIDYDTGNGRHNGNPSTKPSSSRRRLGGFMPIRLNRKEHRDRVLGINTEASSATSAALRKIAEQRSHDEETTTFDDELTSVTRKAATRAKAKSKDVEIVGDSRKWKGVYDDEFSNVLIKQEPIDDSSSFLDQQPESTLETEHTNRNDAVEGRNSVPPEAELETKAGVRAKIRQRKKLNQPPSEFQTMEEIREWDKRQADLQTIQQELGRINISQDPTHGNESGGQPQKDEVEQTDRKEDAIYLFQFPPIMPDLAEPVVKTEPDSPSAGRSKKPRTYSSTEQPMKLEDDFGGDPSAFRSRKLSVAAGWAGKLRVHKSGRATMTWGGADMEMKMGISTYFLQTAILTRASQDGIKHKSNAAGGSTSDTGGEAIAFGQIRGKLVVTPNWSEILS